MDANLDPGHTDSHCIDLVVDRRLKKQQKSGCFWRTDKIRSQKLNDPDFYG